MMNKMNEEVKPLWLNALRNGEFTQGKGVLRDTNDRYCCLGVLCELYARHSGEDVSWDSDPAPYSFLGEVQLLPEEVMDWAGIEFPIGEVLIDGSYTTLAYENDNGYTFAEIADLIEKQY